MSRVGLWALAVLAAPATAWASFVFGSPEHLRRWTEAPGDVAVADFNGDGRDDLAVLAAGKVDVLFQDGSGSLGEPVSLAVPGKGLTAVRAVDVGADGSWQVLAGHATGLVVYTWGGAAFQAQAYPASGCVKIEAADLDADGRPDVLCLAGDGLVTLYYTKGMAGGFGAPVALPTAVMGTVGQPRLKDVTGDGRPDLLLAGALSNSFYVYVNDGTGAFEPGIAHTYDASVYLWPTGIEVLDSDEDGRNEVVVGAPCNKPCSRLYFFRQGADGYLEPSHWIPTLDNPDALLASDVNGDGHSDLIVGHSGWLTIGRHMGRGAEGLAAVALWSQAPVTHRGGALALGDLDSDGATDLAIANMHYGVSLLRGGAAAIRDFNNDFRSDLFWRSGTGETMVWYSADSGQVMTPSQPEGWIAAATGDFDGDTLADVLWRNPATGAVWHYTTMVDAIAVSLEWQVAGVGDFDADGRADLFWRNSRTGANRIWKSGDAEDDVAAARIDDLDWKVVGVGDFDGDGQSDLLWRHAATGRNTLWRSANRTASRSLATVSNLDWNVAGVGDFDGDGRDDVAWRNLSTGANTIWKSANSATTMMVTGVASQRWRIAAVGDYDGDGRDDLMWRHANGTNVVWRAASSKAMLPVPSLTGWEIVP